MGISIVQVNICVIPSHNIAVISNQHAINSFCFGVGNVDKGAYRNNSDQLQANHYYNASGQIELNEVINHIIAPANIDINTIKADYDYNCGKGGRLSVGIKSAWIKTDNDFQNYNVYASGEDLDKDRSNHFQYKENINAGYINMNRQYKKFMIQAGLRIENTESKGISSGSKFDGNTYVNSTTTFPKSYTDFFPSAAITFNKNPMKQWSLTYSRRIDRPAYQDLNPFEFKLDEMITSRYNRPATLAVFLFENIFSSMLFVFEITVKPIRFVYLKPIRFVCFKPIRFYFSKPYRFVDCL